jgi:hypothetical protein
MIRLLIRCSVRTAGMVAAAIVYLPAALWRLATRIG